MKTKILIFIAFIAIGLIGYAFLKKDYINQQNSPINNGDSQLQFNKEEVVIIPKSANNWQTQKTKKYQIDYPKDWFIVKTFLEDGNGFTISTTPTGNAYDFDTNGKKVSYKKEWAKINLAVYKKPKSQSLEEWLKEKAKTPEPDTDTKVEYLKIGNNNFIGTADFKNVSWKNAYIEISDEEILRLSFTHAAPISFQEYSDTFYTLLSSLKISE